MEAIYPLGALDNDGKLLTRAERYVATFKPSLPYAKFCAAWLLVADDVRRGHKAYGAQSDQPV